MPGDLDGKTALVTGGARGLGRGMAERLAAAGAWVAVLDAGPADEVIEAITAAGGRASAIRATIGDEAGIEAMIAGLDAGFGADRSLDILVNNIGGGRWESFETITREYLDWAWGINVCVPFLVTQALAPRLTDGGRVVNISSAGARLAAPEVMVYAMCKAAVENFTRVMAKILGPRRITVNAVAPGFNAAGQEDLKDPSTFPQFAAATLFGRVGEAEDIGNAVLALTLPATAWVTGQIVEASGGFQL